MKMQIKPDAHPTQALACYVGNISEYCSETIDGKLYIVGTKKDDEKRLFTFEHMKSTELLYSLLVLYESLDVHGTVYPASEYDKKVTQDDLSRIIAWCIAHGLPFEESGEESTFSKNSIWRKYGKIGFEVATFYYRLHDIYTCYLLWRVLFLKDTDSENYYVQQQVPIEQCRLFLQSHMQGLDIRYVPDFSNETPSFQIVCPDMMEVAKAQMFFECTVDEWNFTLGICEVCGNVFVKTRKNNTQCRGCQATKVQRLRAKQRREKQQEQEQ